MNPIEQFNREKAERIESYQEDLKFREMSRDWLEASMARKYVYNFTCLDRPVIQYPQDMAAVQELIWRVKPDVVIETGIAHGGSLVLSAAVLALVDYCDAVESRRSLDPRSSRRRVIGVDIDIRDHNRAAIEAHPLAHKIEMIQGSSIDPGIVDQVRQKIGVDERVLVCLDSNHVHDHVLAELEAYAPMVSKGSYCIVFDTFVEDMPDGLFPDRPWCKGNNPKTAVHQFLRDEDARKRFGIDGEQLHFSIDKEIESKLMITVAPDGFLKRV